MTLKTRRFTLFDQLYRVYALEPRSAEGTPEPGITPVLVPVIDIAELYGLEVLISDAMDLTGSGTVVGHTVPEFQRWHLKALTTTPTVATSAVQLADPEGVLLQLNTPTVAQEFLLASVAHIILDPLWTMNRSATGNAGDGSEFLNVLFKRERLN